MTCTPVSRIRSGGRSHGRKAAKAARSISEEPSRLVNTAISELDGGIPRREEFPLRLSDVIAVLAFWALLALISAAGRELDPRVPGLSAEVTSAVVRTTYVEYTLWALLTVPILWLTSRFSIERGRRVERMLMFAGLGLLIAVAMNAIMLEVREWFMEPLPRFRRRSPPPMVGLGMIDDLMVYLAVFGAGVARDYFLRYRARQEETAVLHAQLTQARLDALRSQLNPHFLFNTLNAISALVERDPRGTRRMIARLSDLLRHTLEDTGESEVSLRRELDLLEEYVELMQIRFQGKLTVNIRVAGDAGDALVPNLVLQPLVENAIKHGVARSGGGVITIAAQRRDGMLEIIVSDSGPGPAGGPEGVGLRNTDARLAALYGPAHRVMLRAAPGGGTDAMLAIPFHTRPLVE
jgi:two-component system, LytTR family, sensor kinase